MVTIYKLKVGLLWILLVNLLPGMLSFGSFSRRATQRSLRIFSRLLADPIPTNQELVQRRLEEQLAKRQARQKSLEERHQLNLRVKRLISSSDSYQVPALYAVRVSVCDELREELKLNGRERRGRVFIQVDSDGAKTLKGLKFELHAFFRALRKSTFVLSAGLPDSDEFWPIESDDDVLRTFQAAQEFFANSSDEYKRPTIALRVERDPNAPLPPPPPEYLNDMADPSKSETMTMISFYAFPPNGIQDPEEFAVKLRKIWKPFQALGRVYVAGEGVNAQMSVPTNVLDNFKQACESIPEFQYLENGINIDPIPLTREVFQTAGVPVRGQPAPPFSNLHIRVRHQVVADGLDHSLDWQSAGYDMPPAEWHEAIEKAKQIQQGDNNVKEEAPILLDCRNSYETDLGRFEGAEPLETENFRESWDVLKKRLENTPKDAPIMTYCTGGIRCVKVGAYLTQELGFQNVSRLAGGIIAYDRYHQNEKADEPSVFKGTNFVFDGRLGRPITDDELGTCVTCQAETSLVTNCRNPMCHKRITQCECCRTSFHGTCSEACKQRVVNGAMLPRRQPEDDSNTAKYTSLEDYSVGHSSPVPSFYREVEFNTQAHLPSGTHMVSGAAQGRLLTQLASMSREGRVLELGTFTGYATACLLEGAANAGEAVGLKDGSREGGPFVMTMERDPRALDLAVAHLKIMAEHGVGEAGAEAACAMRGADSVPPLEEESATMTYRGIAGCEVVRVTDALAILEEMAAGHGDIQAAPFDLVFVDADKTRLLEYAEACLASDRVLKKGGLIVVDNVLWKGLVLEASSGEALVEEDHSDIEEPERKRNRRARKLANKMHRFNAAIAKDDRAEVVVLPMRDGLSVIRKR